QVHAKPPNGAVDLAGVGKVGPAIALEDFAIPLVHQGVTKLHHLFVADYPSVHGAQRTIDAHHGWAADLKVQVARLEFNASTKQLVDLEVGPRLQQTRLDIVVLGHGASAISVP